MDFMKSAIFGSYLLKQDEIVYCCKLLFSCENLLKSKIQNYGLEIEKLRLDIAKYYTEILGFLILNKDLDRLMRIEHFEQDDKIGVVKLNEFLPDDFSSKSVANWN
jgi:hypothetical protein